MLYLWQIILNKLLKAELQVLGMLSLRIAYSLVKGKKYSLLLQKDFGHTGL
jgi:hypothetical protein